MNFVIFVLIFIPLTFFAGITFALWKFTHVVLERQGVKQTKWIATFLCILFVSLVLYWFDSATTGRWFGC